VGIDGAPVGIAYDARMDPTIFRMYDIRGIAGEQLDEDLARDVGRALGTRIVRAGGDSCVLGHDVRHSSPALAEATTAGLREAGVSVLFLGQAPTPVVYHALYRRQLGGAVVITGSHNPREYNGIKLYLGQAGLYGKQVASLRDQILEGDFESGSGAREDLDWVEPYTRELADLFSDLTSVRIAADCGNGVMGPVLRKVAARLEIEVDGLYLEPDGDFPHHIPDPEVPRFMEELGRRVVEGSAACGLGFDGDGDRVGVFDERGRKISADWLVALFARDILPEHPGGVVRIDVKCSSFIEDEIRAAGGRAVMGETGHSLLKRDIKKLDAILGGELSGHIVFNREYLPIDDSLYCALRFLRILQRSGGSASELFASFPRLHATAEIKLPVAEARKVPVVRALVDRFSREYEVLALDGARVALDASTWFLVRASNTTPVLTVRLEAGEAHRLQEAGRILLDALRRHPEVDRKPLVEELASRR
jgi:phosphomannomutase/phosphoglucomutase